MGNKKFSVRVSLVTLAISVILLSGGFISLISYYGSKMSIHFLVEGLMENICIHTIDKTFSYMQTAPISAEITEFMFAEKLLDLEKKDVLSRFFKSIIEANPQIVSIYYGNEKDARFLMQRKMEDESISEKYMYTAKDKVVTEWKHSNPAHEKDFPDTEEESPGSYEPRKRPWYADAQKKGEHIWTDIYLFETDRLPGLTYSTPIFYKETLKGVIGIDISIKDLSYFLGEQKIGKSGKAFFINKQYQIVAHPLLKGEKFHAIDETAMDEVKAFRLISGTDIRSSLLEVDNMAKSFQGMKHGLQSFQKYVPADLVRELISIGKEAIPGGEKKELTIYFSDIANFTSIAESLSPEDLVDLLSEYLDSSSQRITDQHGTIDKYIGDSIMAFWGAPIPLENHAINACLAALNVKRNLKVLETKWQGQGKPILKDRIGINTGEVIVGNIGSNSRMNYTVIGDSVNLASRIEGLNKYYGTEILISESTYQKVKDDLFARKIDIVSVKGKQQGTCIYELISEKDKADAFLKAWVASYEDGLNFYLEKKWEKAIASFEKAIQSNRLDAASIAFIKRCQLYKENPPPTDWDGVFKMVSK